MRLIFILSKKLTIYLGGPIQTFGYINDKPRYMQYGVVSGGVECLKVEYTFPGIYTNIQYYLNWILDNMY